MHELIEEGKRCLQCKKPLCVQGCPVNTPIPQMISLFLNSQMKEAGKQLFENNPLSLVCSLICPHERFCEGHCILNRKGAPIRWFKMETYISGFYLDNPTVEVAEPNGFRVGIIGSGPAGITLAFILAKRGYKVTIIDSRDQIGGVLRYGIPEFRLPKDILDKMLELMYQMGINFRPNTLIGPGLNLDDMFRDGYDAIFIGTGVWKPNKLGILGESLGHVHYAIDYLKNPKSYRLGKRVAVIGAGNVAMDVARVALRNHHSEVTIIHHRGHEDMTASVIESEMARLDGVMFKHYLNAIQITDTHLICEPVIKRMLEDGSVVYDHDSEKLESLVFDSVITAIGQGPQANIVNHAQNLFTNGKGLLTVNANGMTSIKGVFASGDVVTGAKTVVEAVELTKQTADAIEAYCYSLKQKAA